MNRSGPLLVLLVVVLVVAFPLPAIAQKSPSQAESGRQDDVDGNCPAGFKTKPYDRGAPPDYNGNGIVCVGPSASDGTTGTKTGTARPAQLRDRPRIRLLVRL